MNLLNHENTMDSTHDTRRERPASSISSAILGASAFVLGGLTLMQAGRFTQTAHASEAANSGQLGFSMATVRSGLGPNDRPYDLVFVIDSRAETLFVYYIENTADKRVYLRQVVSLPALFRQARGG